MQTNTQQTTVGESHGQGSSDDPDGENRRLTEDRRSTTDRRRSARGLFELRARDITDRRQTRRRSTLRSWFGFGRNNSN